MNRYRVTPRTVIPGDPSNSQSFPDLPETEVGKIGQYAQEGDKAIVDDFIRKPGAPLAVFGGNYTLAGGLDLNIFKPLRVWRADDGAQFDDFDDAVTVINLATADETDPRIDLIYVTLAEDADGASETRHFSKDPTDPDALQGDATIFTEKQNTLEIGVVQGTPAADPQIPTLPASSAEMYRVIVPSGVVNLTTDNVIDVRHNFLTLEEIAELVGDLIDDVNDIKDKKHRHPADQVDIGPGAGKYANMTDQQAWNLLGSQSDAKKEDPVFRPETLTPEVVPSSIQSGKLGSTPTTDGSLPVVDIPVGRQVAFFGGSLRTIEPSAFPAAVEGTSINARFVNKHVNEATDSRKHSIDLNLATISAIQSDGGGDWSLTGAVMPSARYNWPGGRFASARDDRYIEVMGGLPGSGTDWHTFDTQAETFTQRLFSGQVPTSSIVFVIGCGNGKMLVASRHIENQNIPQFYPVSPAPAAGVVAGTVYDEIFGTPLAGAVVTLSHGGGYEQTQVTGAGGTYSFTGVPENATAYVLAVSKAGYLQGDIALSMAIGAPNGSGYDVVLPREVVGGGSGLDWFLVDTANGQTTMFPTNARPDSVGETGVWGALVQPNVIFLIVSSANNRHWIYHVDTNVFEPFVPTGIGPSFTPGQLPMMDMCLYRIGEAVLFQSQQNSRTTKIFNYSTRSWTTLNIAQPTADLNQIYGGVLWGCTLANINGRPQLTSESSSVWELSPGTQPQWDNRGIAPGFGSNVGTSLFGRGFVGFVGMLENGLPGGAGYVLGGRVANSPKSDVWKFEAGGIIEVLCGGVTGLTLGGGASQASFVVDDGFTLPWQVATVVANPIGNIPSGSIKLELQFDNEAWIEITRDVLTQVSNLGSTPVRRWRITLFGTAASKPCISKLNEIFEQVGGPGLNQLVLRYNIVTAGVRYLYMSRAGAITIEATAQMTTPDKAFLTKITPNGISAPTVLDMVNKRLIHRKYSAARASGQTPAIANDFPVLPAYIKAWLKAATGEISDLADPTVTFNSPIAVTGLTVDGQIYLVELEA